MARPKKGRTLALLVGCALVVLCVAVAWMYREDLRAWYALWRDFESLGRNEQGHPEYRHRQTGIVFVGLPAGTFLMGSPEGEDGPKLQSGGQREVTVNRFLIAKYEASRAEWLKLAGGVSISSEGGRLPVVSVSRADCRSVLETAGLDLPTEAQWEYACRAGTKGPHAGTGSADEMGWHRGNSGGKVHPVGQKHPNDFGLHDMHGNVSEWCADESDSALGMGGFVVRGGGYGDRPAVCRSAMRIRGTRGARSASLGFRPSWSPP